MSSDRKDAFALEGTYIPTLYDSVTKPVPSVYETSLFLSVLFSSPFQTTSALSHLSPDLYTSSYELQTPSPLPATLVALLFHLVSRFPSQSLFHERIYLVPLSFLPHGSAARCWLGKLTAVLRSLNYAAFEEVAATDRLASLLPPPLKNSAHQTDLALVACQVLVNTLRTKFRSKSWAVLRSAYRELPCHTGSSTRTWLIHTLGFEQEAALDDWLEKREKDGHVKRKEGVEGRWLMCKVT